MMFASTPAQARIGIDLGGTKIEIVVLGADNTVLHQRRVATPQGDYAATVDTLVRLVGDAEQTLGLTCSVGIGIPGTLSPDHGRVKNANSTCLIGEDLQGDLERRLGRAVRIANDADCFALSEARDGAGAGAPTVFGVILGTGCGGGLVVNGQLIGGPNGIAGEWGHNPLPWRRPDDGPPRPCYCGKHDCIETFLSGPGLQQTLIQRLGHTVPVEGLTRDRTAAVQAALDQHADQVARSLALVINILDPWVIVLGGGVSNLAGLAEAVSERLPPHVFSDRVNTRLTRHCHGDASGVRGAAWLWSIPEAPHA